MENLLKGLNVNQEQQEFCQKWNLTENQFFGKEPINGDLNLHSVTSIPKGFNPTVSGNLYLDSVKSIPAGFNPTVGGSLYLPSVKSIPAGFNPIVGGWLDLDSVKSIPAGFNPTVGESLYLRSVTSIPAGFNPIVGGSLYLNSGRSQNKKPCPSILSWQDGKYVKVDGIFTEVISKKKNVWKVKNINQDKIFYIVTDGNGKYSHGDSIKDAKSSLMYKITDRDPSKYKHLTIESSLTTPEMIACYRTITGACEFGVKNFIQNSLNGKLKKNYKIKDIIELTQNQYGYDSFKKFFNQ